MREWGASRGLLPGSDSGITKCPSCGAEYAEEGELDDGSWWRTCDECWDPDEPGSMPMNWDSKTGEQRRDFM